MRGIASIVIKEDEDRVIIAVKFSKNEHTTSLQKEGLIYMNPVSYFQKLDNDKHRGDGKENLTHVWQPDQVMLRMNEHTIAAEDIAGTIDVYNPPDDKNQATHIFCLSCLSEKDMVRDDYKIFDDCVREFKDTDTMLIITNLTEMDRRLRNALQKLESDGLIVKPNYDRVSYVDYSSYHGEVDIFTKSTCYEYQKEWRLTVSTPKYSKVPFQFKVGNIEDISIALPLKDFKNKVIITDDNKVMLDF
ncbi:hypothetical protein KAR91_13155 [Candidatus Pacearchaeota archaeon]|nr:hypothetical protein [Candidatus Pacearchaeota archaeon]